jgi:alpha-beta hydrolase superfamily lysophospholipase
MPAFPAAQPVHFGDEHRSAVGWWHAPSGRPADASRLPVLICPPHGREDECAYRTLRVLAERLAAAGHPVLRFEFPGTGDAAGDAYMPDLVPTWEAAIAAGLDGLKAQAGCSRVAVVGLRLGALLAAGVAASRDDVAAFVAIAPPVSGRAFVREMKAFELTSAAVGRADPASGLTEAGGHVLTSAARDALSRLGPAALERPPAPCVLVVDRDDVPSAAPWIARLAELGVSADRESHPGFADMMLDPHLGEVPQSMVDALANWLARQPLVPAGPAVEGLRHGPIAVSDGVVEEPAWMTVGGARIFGILSQAATGATPSRIVLLLNAGAQRRSGSGRLHVLLARRWAAGGAAVLRIDLPGLGDAPPRAGERDNIVYPHGILHELRDLVRQLRERWPRAGFHAVGICSGAFHALQLAFGHGGVDGVVALNPLTFSWPGEGLLLEPLPAYMVTQEMSRYRRSPFSRHRWRKLLHGEVDVRRVARLLARHVGRSVVTAWRELARLLRLPLRDDLAGELGRATADGTVVHFVFSENEPGEDLLRSLAGRAVARLQRRHQLHLHRMDDADHTFTGAAARERVAALMDALFQAPPPPPPGRPPRRAEHGSDRPVVGARNDAASGLHP